jgi:two-component system, NarL family, nitrate/nitrite response regulator NarL
MLVDDVQISNFIMKKMIANAANSFEIYDFTDPSNASDQLATINPDIIFLDLNMPVLDGWGFLEAMKENEILNKVYILTSSTSELDRERSGLYNNVVGFLTKPVNKKDLEEILLS